MNKNVKRRYIYGPYCKVKCDLRRHAAIQQVCLVFQQHAAALSAPLPQKL